MAVKTSQIIYDVREILNEYSDDGLYDDRYILYLYDLKRQKYLRQLLDDKSRNFDKEMMQSLCIAVEEIDKGLCGLDVQCTILRSIKPIPKTLAVRNRETLISITSPIMLSKSFKIVDFTQASTILDRPYSNSIYTTIDIEGYVYIFSNIPEYKLIDCVTVTGIFSTPSDLENYVDCCNCQVTESCFTLDSDYPAPAYIIDMARDEIIKLLTVKEQSKPDEQNNSSDS